MEIVPQRDAATLLPIIQAHVANGTIIHSDQWAAYNRVASIPGVASHASVNHSINFVDPSTGVHTQNIESYWNSVSVVNALAKSEFSKLIWNGISTALQVVSYCSYIMLYV